jgi:hypothetical protein
MGSQSLWPLRAMTKLGAVVRLRSTWQELYASPVTSKTYLERMGDLYAGRLLPTHNDCRLSVVQAIKKDSDPTNLVYVIGDRTYDSPIHTFLMTNHGSVVVDKWGGKLNGSKYTVTLKGDSEDYDVLQKIDVRHFLDEYVTKQSH